MIRVTPAGPDSIPAILSYGDGPRPNERVEASYRAGGMQGDVGYRRKAEFFTAETVAKNIMDIRDCSQLAWNVRISSCPRTHRIELKTPLGSAHIQGRAADFIWPVGSLGRAFEELGNAAAALQAEVEALAKVRWRGIMRVVYWLARFVLMRNLSKIRRACRSPFSKGRVK